MYEYNVVYFDHSLRFFIAAVCGWRSMLISGSQKVYDYAIFSIQTITERERENLEIWWKRVTSDGRENDAVMFIFRKLCAKT